MGVCRLSSNGPQTWLLLATQSGLSPTALRPQHTSYNMGDSMIKTPSAIKPGLPDAQ